MTAMVYQGSSYTALINETPLIHMKGTTMTQTPIRFMALPEAQFRQFLPIYQAWMKEVVNPGYIGVTFIKFKAELAKDGYDIIAETIHLKIISSIIRMCLISFSA